ncbi:MAG: glycosyltransferase, partial [Anaerolineales bacterium]|nr:glycosyltransferase [Anaerolineales bacterium]MDW8447403.1 glycosyltransferase [Anaerolineales bacterium]
QGKSKMRIGMLTDVYKPYVSGITNYIELNKKWLEQKGHEVFVFTFGGENYTDGEERNIIRSPGLPLLDTGYYLGFRYSSEATRLLRMMDIVHVHHPFLSGSLSLRYCRPRGIPIVFTNHTRYDLYARAYLPVLGELVGEPALEAYLPVFCRAVDVVISPSDGMRKVLLRLGVNVEIQVVPNGVDLTAFRQPIQAAHRVDLGFDEQNIVLIYVGRLGPEKNLPFLIRCFAGVIQAFPQTRLLLVGDGPEKKTLQELVSQLGISPYVCFTGMVPYERVCQYLKMADVFVTASVTEVHPLSVIEAMAAGLPVLGIHSPGISDTVCDGVSGFLVGEEDMVAYAAKMARMISDKEERRRMGEAAQKEAERFSIDQTGARMLEIYREAIEKKAEKQRSFSVRVRRLLDRIG